MNQPPTHLPATPSPQVPDQIDHTDRTIAAQQTNAQRGMMWMEAHGDA